MRRLLLTLGLLAAATPAAAQTLADYDYENLAFRGFGVDGGYIWAEKVVDTQMYSLRLDLGYLGPGVRIIPSISYWSSEITESELEELALRMNEVGGVFIEPSDLAPITWSDLAVSLDGHFVWNTPIRVLTYVGAGFSLHALNGQGEAIDDTFVEDMMDAITAGVAAMAGLEFQPIDRIRLYGEGRYTALYSMQYLSVRGGIQLMFSQGGEVEVGAVPAPGLEGVAP